MAAFARTVVVSTAILVAASGIEGCEILANRMGCLLCLRPCNRLVARYPFLLVHIRLDQARIDRERFAPNQPGRNAHRHHSLEDPAQGIALSEAFLPRTAEHGVVGYFVFDAELAEPTIGKVDLNLGANPPLRTDRKHVAN